METYKIVRFYNSEKPNRAVRGMNGLTLAEAQEHCHDPESSYKTCTNAIGKARTRKYGPWFDGFREETS